nr:MAG TPA: hypothetical protein [Caudoviricetes sp.]
MNKLNYPNRLVPLYIAKELKEIGFNEPTLFHYYENDFDVTIETNDYYNEGEAQGYLSFYIPALKEEDFNHYKIQISIPTWEQVFQWFRSKGYHCTLHTYSVIVRNAEEFRFYYEINSCQEYVAAPEEYYKIYEQARETLVYKLIEIYKSEQNENLHIRKD